MYHEKRTNKKFRVYRTKKTAFTNTIKRNSVQIAIFMMGYIDFQMKTLFVFIYGAEKMKEREKLHIN